jgi:hypothetical protein
MKPADYIGLNPKQTLDLSVQLASRLTPEQFALQEEAVGMAARLSKKEVVQQVNATWNMVEMVHKNGDAQPIRAAVQAENIQSNTLLQIKIMSDKAGLGLALDRLAESNPLRNGAFSELGYNNYGSCLAERALAEVG